MTVCQTSASRLATRLATDFASVEPCSGCKTCSKPPADPQLEAGRLHGRAGVESRCQFSIFGVRRDDRGGLQTGTARAGVRAGMSSPEQHARQMHSFKLQADKPFPVTPDMVCSKMMNIFDSQTFSLAVGNGAKPTRIGKANEAWCVHVNRWLHLHGDAGELASLHKRHRSQHAILMHNYKRTGVANVAWSGHVHRWLHLNG